MANRIRSRSSFIGRSGVKRSTIWLGSADVVGTGAIAAATSLLQQAITGAVLFAVAPAGTIVRTRGTLWVKSDQIAATESPVGAMGMMVVKDTARIAGVAAIPTPATENTDDGWFMHQYWSAGMVFASAIGIQNLWHRYDFDSKAQRKFGDGDSIVVVLENSHATDGVEFQLSFRMLLKVGASA